MRHSMANEKKFKKGPSTKESGCTQASVSERMIDEDAKMSAVVSEAKASNPTFFKAGKAKSTGDACKAEFRMTDEAEVQAAKVGIARPAF
mmetsp:Transcript_27747/g.58935  ORF Transcript_27747/g.58935 Transcript_27747/m.58935 type:complete len:90 (-) Transcript_27747:209-478(-)